MSDYQIGLPSTFSVSVPVLAAGTTSTLSTTNAVNYCIKGKAYTKAALSNTATPTTDFATGAAFTGVVANKGSVFAVGLNTSGTLKAVQGTITDLDSAGKFVNAPQFGPMPDNFCPFGYIVIKAGSTANATTGWVFGTSNMASVTGITYTFVDVMVLPDRPQVA